MSSLASERLCEQFIVTAAQMQEIESRVFAAGMPVAALMEKVAGRISDRVMQLYPRSQFPRLGLLVGPGHNGGDALVVGRELHFRGYQVQIFCPFDPSQFKDLTQQHFRYLESLGIEASGGSTNLSATDFKGCDWLLDGLFGFGLNRELTGEVALLIKLANQSELPIVSIDLPSGLETDQGRVLGQAIRATQTLCLGLWKRGLFQEDAIEYLGELERLDFDLPIADIVAVLGDVPALQRMTDQAVLDYLPLSRSLTTHKYKMGHLLLVCGSERYAGAAILAGLGARGSGVGMLSIAIPQSLKSQLTSKLPEALIIGCPETSQGAIQALPESLTLNQYSAIACGCGLTSEPAPIVEQILSSDRPVILDADGLNIVAQQPDWLHRTAPTVLTPHLGEFRRLFPQLEVHDRIKAAATAATQSGTIVLLKGARIMIADPQGNVWINPQSTPALARGGSGDVLTGLMAGLLAQANGATVQAVQAAAWWHAQAGIWAANDRTQLGVDAHTLAQSLIPALQVKLGQIKKTEKNACQDAGNLC